MRIALIVILFYIPLLVFGCYRAYFPQDVIYKEKPVDNRLVGGNAADISYKKEDVDLSVPHTSNEADFDKENVHPTVTLPLATQYDIIARQYTLDESVVKYPQLISRVNGKDFEKTNQILYRAIMELMQRYVKPYPDKPDYSFFTCEYEVKLRNDDILSVIFYGMNSPRGAAHPSKTFHCITINLDNARIINPLDSININEILATKVLKGRPSYPHPSLREMQYNCISEYTPYKLQQMISSFYEYFKTNYKYSCGSYLTEDSVGISVSLSYSIGGYAPFEILYSDVVECLKYDSFLSNFLDYNDVILSNKI